MFPPSVMSDTERLMLDAIEKEFYHNIDSGLNTLGYTGSFRNPYDERKNTTGRSFERKIVKKLFDDMPHPLAVGLLPARAKDSGCRFYIDADRDVDEYSARWLIDSSSNANTRMENLVSMAKPFNESSVMITFTDITQPVEVLKAFGLDPACLDVDSSFEDIEVDIDNPLSQDFPPPVDII